MYLLIIILPLLSFLSCGLLGGLLGRNGSNLISFTCMFACFFVCLLAFYEIGFSGSYCYLQVGSWINSSQFRVSWGFSFDSLTVTMLIVVSLISMLVHLYSIKYMEKDPHCPRFMSYLSIFSFFMIFLVSSDNLLQMFLGWEGVGLVSYLLINFWSSRLYANQSAIKALIINRIGDFSLILSILATFYVFHSIEYSTIFSSVPLLYSNTFVLFNYSLGSLNLIGLFLCIGAFGKSAQLGLHSWLPDAMEGPTPVSALIHSATMVTAGVFLIARFSPLLEYTPNILFILVVIGSITAFFGSLIATFQNDLKKVVAYSTCSQLGYMIFICGISYYQVGVFHLVNHAFFKALLFLASGSIIHALKDEQDIRRMGSLNKFLPLTYSLMIIGSLALIGFPFLTGFYSKDVILELSQVFYYANLNKTYGVFAYWLGSISVFFTSYYCFRLIYMVFLNSTNIKKVCFSTIHDSSFIMSVPLVVLALGSIFFGYLTKDLFIGLGSKFWGTAIFTLPENNNIFEAEIIPWKIKWFPFLFSLGGFGLTSTLNLFAQKSYNFFFCFKKITWFYLFTVNKKLYFDNLYNKVFTNLFLLFGYHSSFKLLDKGFLEVLGPYGLSHILKRTSKNWEIIQSGQITHYIYFILLGLSLGLLIQFFSIFHLNVQSDLLFSSFLYLSIFFSFKSSN